MFTMRPAPKLKRVLDLIIGVIVSVLAAPVLLVVVLVVKATSAGPVVYSQTRVGRDRRIFTIYKIRTMYQDCERFSGPCWSSDNDPRVTPFGRLLRGTHLDELPQIWNVLRGDMSLVGPRPERPEFLPELEKALPHYGERLTVAPGVTGLAQVNLPPDSDHESVRRKLVYDIYYAENQGTWLDLKIIACTGLFLAGVPFSASVRLFGLAPWNENEDEASAERGGRHGVIEAGAGIEMVSQALPAWRDL